MSTRIAPEFPAGHNRAQRLKPLFHGAVRDVRPGRAGEASAEKRREITRNDPLLFALLYLPSYLCDEVTGAMSLSDLHLDLCDRARHWVKPVRDRSAWAAHRDAGKTVWLFLVLPLWALAHGHRTFYLALSHTGDQAKAHLSTLRRVIDGGGLLLRDFSHLAPKKGVGYRNTAHWVTSGGVTFSAAGLGETILGRRDDEKRPNLIVGDDLEPGPEDWTPQGKAKVLGRLTNDVLRMGSRRAAVVLTGTPTSAGSLMHDVVRAVRSKPGALEDRGAWVRAEQFAPHWYPAIVDAGTPRQHSAWERHWPLAELLADQAATPREFALQMMCDPDDPAAVQWWTDDERTSVFRFHTGFRSDYRILSIDGAVTSDRKDVDHTAIVILAVGPGSGTNRRVCVEYAAAGSWPRTETRARAQALTAKYPKTLKTWLVETNQGGEMWREALEPAPDGVTIEPFTAQGSKRHRIESLYDRYAEGTVWHSGNHLALQGQMTTWKPGKSGHGIDDLIDATGAAVRLALYGNASKAPARTRRRRAA